MEKGKLIVIEGTDCSGFVSLIKAQSNDFKKCHFLQSKVGNLVNFNLLFIQKNGISIILGILRL